MVSPSFFWGRMSIVDTKPLILLVVCGGEILKALIGIGELVLQFRPRQLDNLISRPSTVKTLPGSGALFSPLGNWISIISYLAWDQCGAPNLFWCPRLDKGTILHDGDSISQPQASRKS